MLKRILKLSGRVIAGRNSGKRKNTGILWGGSYNTDYSKYEKNFPPAYPFARPNDANKSRFVRGNDGYWYNPDENKSNKAVI